MIILDIKKDLFRAWLLEANPAFVSIFAGNVCPIAQYLNSLDSSKSHYVWSSGVVSANGENIGSLPDWGSLFINKVDDADIDKSRCSKGVLTSVEVVEILDSLE